MIEGAPAAPARRLRDGACLPIATVLLAVLAIWYAAALVLNAPAARAVLPKQAGIAAFAGAAWSQTRPLLPAPQQIAGTLARDLFGWPLNAPRNLFFQASATVAEAALGLAFALALGILLAVAIVHLRAFDRSLMPWVIASQTVPVLAIAPMVVVVLGNLGLSGLLPKAAIAGYLAFFPITVGMVKGLRAPDPLQLDLMRTYSASRRQVFAKLRWPASLSFLFPNLRIAVALAVVGAIVAELPTGAQAGLGARLLAGSYYGQTLQLWATLVMASLVSLAGLGAVGLIERGMRTLRGGRL